MNLGPVNVGESPADFYTAAVRYAGREPSLPGSSAEKFVGEHYEIESTGASSRGAQDVQVQGVVIVSAPGAVNTYQRIGKGLEAEGTP